MVAPQLLGWLLVLVAGLSTAVDAFAPSSVVSTASGSLSPRNDIHVSTTRWQSRHADDDLSETPNNIKPSASNRQMLGFAIPALGIFLCNPLLSNIDNGFVGRTVGSQGLAALSPATVCTDQMLYLCSFLGRATTGLVSKAYAYNETQRTGNLTAARDAASPALTVSLMLGTALTAFYFLFTPLMLSALNVAPTLHQQASAYIYWRGAIAWAALAQNVLLNILLATRDAITPLKIVLLAALVNFFGDTFCCVWPFRMGCAGAAAATSFATLFSSACMLQTLHKKQLLPRLHLPTRKQCWELLQFTGPLLAITFVRLLGQINMQQAASKLGVGSLSAFQMGINLMFLFQLFGEPLSQLSQTRLPSLVADADATNNQPQLIRTTIKSILILAVLTAVPIGAAAGLTMGWGNQLFTSDPAIQLLARNVAPALFITVTTGILSSKYHYMKQGIDLGSVFLIVYFLCLQVSMDGALVASKDFVYMLGIAVFSNFLQWKLLVSPWCNSVSAIFYSFTVRLATYALAGATRVALGYGPLGRALWGLKTNKKTA
jgi:Na+-driven multidrug efflux pump